MPEGDFNKFVSNMNENEDMILQDMLNEGNDPESMFTFPELDFSSTQVPTPPATQNYQLPQAFSSTMSMHTPRRLVQDETSFKTEVSSSCSPLSFEEDSVNLSQYRDIVSSAPTFNNILASPLLVLSLEPWGGLYNFKVTIPPPNLEGVKPKWCFSSIMNKLYVAKQVAFPVNVTLDTYPVGAVLVACPVYTKSSHRTIPVNRCPNCEMSDRNSEVKEHVVQVEGSSPSYFIQENRNMVSVPLGPPPPGDTSVHLFLKVACNTSCVGGPNRRPFSILFTLRLRDREIGRQVINVKCCEGPTRDMGKDEKQELSSKKEQDFNMESVRRVASQVANCASRKTIKKTGRRTTSATEDQLLETFQIPKKYVKKVKRYVNYLHARDQMKEKKLKKYFPNETESE